MKKLPFLFVMFAISCRTPKSPKSDSSKSVKMEASFIECPREKFSGQLTIRVTNETDKKWYINPTAIVFPVFTKQNTAASKNQISHRTSLADSLIYKLEPFGTVTFKLAALNFNDYKLQTGEDYYTIGSYIPLVGEKFIDGYKRIDHNIETSKIPFKVCLP